jgi:hypothetical protein
VRARAAAARDQVHQGQVRAGAEEGLVEDIIKDIA